MDSKLFLTETFEVVGKANATITGKSYPTLSYTGSNHATFNKAAANVLGNTPKLKFFKSTNYIAILPTDENDADGYCYRSPNSARTIKARSGSSEVTTPVSFKEMKLRHGLYRCYEYKNGLVFDRYNPETTYDKPAKNAKN